MNKKWMPLLLILVLAVVLFFVKRYNATETTDSKKNITAGKDRNDPTTIDRNRGFDRRVSYIEYTEHAKCRMLCRKISQAEVEEIMQDGKINTIKAM